MNRLSSDMVSRIEYDEKEQECLAKDEQIQVDDPPQSSRRMERCRPFRYCKPKFVAWNIYFT